MINKILISLIFFYTTNAFSGISVIGTRFIMDNKKNQINIKIENDKENDYLIKNEVDDNDFIISPPLLLLPRNKSNIITIVKHDRKNYKKDKIINLTITSIPKSEKNDVANTISLAVRNHFKIIYRHDEIKDDDYNKISIFHESESCYLQNNSNFVFTVSLINNLIFQNEKLINFPPGEIIEIEKNNHLGMCIANVNFHNEYNNIIKNIVLKNNK